MKNFDGAIAEILEVDTVNMDDEFINFKCWDSLTVLSIIAFAEENYNVALSASEINSVKTVGGLKELINGKM